MKGFMISRNILNGSRQLFRIPSVTSCKVGRFFASDGRPEEPVSRYPIPDPQTLPADLRQVMEENKEKAGFVPNVFRTLSHRPLEMKAFLVYYEAVMNDREGSRITKADKEMIIVAVSAYNRCRYCVIAHSALYRIYSKDTKAPDQVAANWETAYIGDREKAILKFAMQIGKCLPLTDEHFQELYKHGFDKEDAWDIGAVAAFFSLSNRMAFLTEMIPNDEFYMLGRIPREKSSS